MSGSRYTELDALRGIAAVLVVLFHFNLESKNSPLIFGIGVTGVDLFFIISGFVIFMSINKVTTAKEFIINRFSRLYPTYWICVTFTFALILWVQCISVGYKIPLESLWKYLANMTMFQHYLGVRNIVGPSWTLIIEMVFYIVILLLFLVNQLKNIEWWGVGVFILIAAYDFFEDHYPVLHHVIKTGFPLIEYWALFFAGILFYKIYTEKSKHIIRYTLITICYFIQIKLFDHVGSVFVSKSTYILLLSVYFLVFFLFINRKLRLIANTITLYLGTISYALYLVHEYIGHLIINILVSRIGLNFWIAAIITLGVVILLASLITFYIELPVRGRLKNMFSTKKSMSVKV